MIGYGCSAEDIRAKCVFLRFRTPNPDLSKILDPAIEKRRCVLRRHKTVVQGVEDYHTNVDIMSHLGTHVEAPYHHGDLKKDITDLPPDHYVGRGVLFMLDTCQAAADKLLQHNCMNWD